MATTHFILSDEEEKMVLEVMEKVRRQQYTPERLCRMQNILDAQYYYWWMNDMKKEEYGLDLYTKDFTSYCSGYGDLNCTPLEQCRNAKYCNQFLNTMHMGHQPMIWLIDDTHARGIFLFESHMTYQDDPEEILQQFCIYCNDFLMEDDGVWRISAYRLIFRKQCGELHSNIINPPKGYQFENWETK